MAAEHFLNLQPGTIVNGCYEVVKSLGTGSMGTVYACRHRELTGHIVAMKVLFPDVARDEVIATRFRNEIVSSYRVSHPNVVRAYEYFRDGDLIAFTMEYIPGGDLADKIASPDRLAIPDILRMLIQMCMGVQAIHEAGIIHRDLKPENILLTANGEIKITDFGIARAGTGPRLTEHGGVVGTIEYVSPEYLEKGEVDARSDIYALGVIAYEMITKQSPFKGKSPIETMTLRLRTDPDSPHILRPECPVELSQVVLKAMARDYAHRYNTAKDMCEDLEKVPKEAVPRLLAAASSKMIDFSEESASANTGFGAGFSEDSLSSQKISRQPQRYNDSEVLETHVEPIERVLNSPSSRAHNEAIARRGEPDSGGSQSQAVGVSQSRLSAERLKALSRTARPKATRLKNISGIVSAGFIVMLGFGVGVFLLKQFRPELFEPSVSEALPVSIASGE